MLSLWLTLGAVALSSANIGYDVTSCKVSSCHTYCIVDSQKNPLWFILQFRDQISNGDFNRTFSQYQQGFGSLEEGSFWMGLDCVSEMSNSYPSELLVEVQGNDLHKVTSHYSQFNIEKVNGNFKMNLGSLYEDSSDDFLSGLDGQYFTSLGMDSPFEQCALKQGGGWWYNNQNCQQINMNALYVQQEIDETNIDSKGISTLMAFKFKKMIKTPQSYIPSQQVARTNEPSHHLSVNDNPRPKSETFEALMKEGDDRVDLSKLDSYFNLNDEGAQSKSSRSPLLDSDQIQAFMKLQPDQSAILGSTAEGLTAKPVVANTYTSADSIDLYDVLYDEIKKTFSSPQKVPSSTDGVSMNRNTGEYPVTSDWIKFNGRDSTQDWDKLYDDLMNN